MSTAGSLTPRSVTPPLSLLDRQPLLGLPRRTESVLSLLTQSASNPIQQKTTSFGHFRAYEDPHDPFLLYSTRHIASLTVQAAMHLKPPKICGIGELQMVEWSAEVPTDEILTLLDPAGHIPHIEDLRSILGEAIIRFGYAMRSVKVSVRGHQYLVHFRDIRRWSNLNYLEERIRRVQPVLELILEHRLLSTPEYLTILQGRFDNPLQGFGTNPPKLTSLHELLGENWLSETILDARISLLSDELNRMTPNLIRILNCAFLVELSTSFHRLRVSRMLSQIREELLVNPPFLLAFIINKNGNHWAPTVTSLNLRLVLQGDSYGYPDEPQLLEMIRWWLKDVVPEDGEWNERDLAVPQQSSESGSCGLAAVSAVANLARLHEDALNGPSDIPRSRSWTDATSFAVRCEWIQLILRRHLLTLESQPIPVQNDIDSDSDMSDLDIFVETRQSPPPAALPTPPPVPQSPASSESSLESPSAPAHDLPGAALSHFTPTVPASESGSPKKDRNAPLDPTRPQKGMVFDAFCLAIHFVQEYERRRGYRWRKGEPKKLSETRKRIRLLCSSARMPYQRRKDGIDPSDFRKSKSLRTDCPCRVNITHNADGYFRLTTVNLTHNHPAHLDDELPETWPPSQEQTQFVLELVPIANLTQRDVKVLLDARYPDHPLKLSQVSNMMNRQKRVVHDRVDDIGGDMQAMVTLLAQKKQADDRWVVHIEVDEVTNHFRRLFWQSPAQVAAGDRFGDVIINDVALMRNQYNVPLNTWVVINHRNKTQVIAYALHTTETIEDHQWVLCILFTSLRPRIDRVYVSDFDLALDHVVGTFGIYHVLCLHHLSGNLAKNLAPVLGVLFQPFLTRFWQTYYSVSPAAFDVKWAALLTDFPRSRDYLERVMEPTKERWAWHWTATRFTCGVRTSGRVESENRVNKMFGNTKCSLFSLVKNLIKRSDEQVEQEQLAARESSRTKHPSGTDRLFHIYLEQIREFCVAFAVQRSYQEMESSTFYRVEVQVLPCDSAMHTIAITDDSTGITDQNMAADQAELLAASSKSLLNSFEDDDKAVSIRHLLSLLHQRKWPVRQLFKVTRISSDVRHYVTVLESGHIICDCMMGMNLGIPCRHTFSLFYSSAVTFHVSLFNARWFLDPDMELSKIQGIRHSFLVEAPLSMLQPMGLLLPGFLVAGTPPPVTRTLDPKVIHHQAVSKLKVALNHIHTAEDLQNLNSRLDAIIDQQEFNHRPDIIAPLIVKSKGRPRHKRLTSAVERSQKSLKRARFDPALDVNDAIASTAEATSSVMATEAVTGPCKPAGVRGKRHCRNCGEAGHYATTCSRRA